MHRAVLALALLASSLCVRNASAEPHALDPGTRASLEEPSPPGTNVLAAQPMDDEFSAAPAKQPQVSLELDPERRWAVVVEGFGGIGVLKTSVRTEAHSFGGGMARFRMGYFQGGGYIELSDRDDYSTRTYGGLIGGYFPFRSKRVGAVTLTGKWVDLEAVLGLGVRTYTSRDQRYGAGGFEESTPVGTLRLGVSDRSGEDTLAARFGAQIIASFDFSPKRRDWELSYESQSGNAESVSGTTHIGGYSIGMALTLGLDIGRRY